MAAYCCPMAVSSLLGWLCVFVCSFYHHQGAERLCHVLHSRWSVLLLPHLLVCFVSISCLYPSSPLLQHTSTTLLMS